MNKSAQAAAAVAFLGVVTALTIGTLSPNPTTDHHHSRVEFDGGQPAGLRCYTVQARASRAALSLFGGITAHDGGEASEYVLVTVAYQPSDAGGAPSLPAGMDPLNDTAVDGLCDGGAAQVEAWAQGSAPLPCACAVPDSGVLVVTADGGTAPAPYQTLQPGTWLTDAGTVIPKVCVEWAGSASWPPECGP